MTLSHDRRRALFEAAQRLDEIIRLPYSLGDDVTGMARLDNDALSLLVRIRTLLQRDDEAIFTTRTRLLRPKPKKAAASERVVIGSPTVPRRGPRP